MQFAADIKALCISLKKSDFSNIIFQIKKSSSRFYANVSEAQYPQSLPDMLSKFKIARKECMETESWLKLLLKSNYLNEEEYKSLRNQCGRIRRILTSSCITIENHIK